MTAWFRALVAVMLLALATAGNAAAQPVSSSKTLKAWANWPYQSYCGGEAISPVPLFSSPAGAENGARPAEVGLREVIYNPEIAWIGLATQGYRLLDEDADSASFVSGGLNEGPRYLSTQSGWAVEIWRLGPLLPQHRDRGGRNGYLEPRLQLTPKYEAGSRPAWTRWVQ